MSNILQPLVNPRLDLPCNYISRFYSRLTSSLVVDEVQLSVVPQMTGVGFDDGYDVQARDQIWNDLMSGECDL